MTQQHTHFVDFPTTVSLNGSVAKISFGVGENTDDLHTVHTIAMPIAAFVALARHLKETVADATFQAKIEESLAVVKTEIREANALPTGVAGQN